MNKIVAIFKPNVVVIVPVVIICYILSFIPIINMWVVHYPREVVQGTDLFRHLFSIVWLGEVKPWGFLFILPWFIMYGYVFGLFQNSLKLILDSFADLFKRKKQKKTT